jgi:hypothetical protein
MDFDAIAGGEAVAASRVSANLKAETVAVIQCHIEVRIGEDRRPPLQDAHATVRGFPCQPSPSTPSRRRRIMDLGDNRRRVQMLMAIFPWL